MGEVWSLYDGTERTKPTDTAEIRTRLSGYRVVNSIGPSTMSTMPMTRKT